MKEISFFIFLSFYQILFAQGSATGLIPINDLKSSFYKNHAGGLYPNSSNTRPFKHDSLGLEFSRQIKPLDISGNIDTAKGKYVLLSIGMSNTTQEFSYFKTIADTFKSKNPKLLIVDGAQGGQTASIISNPNAAFWTNINQRLQTAGVNSKQVQVCWVKEADAGPNKPFPDHANILLNEFVQISKILKQKYPNCKIAYWSSRIYGGYATSTLNPEPYAYESAFAVKWLIEKQIFADTSLTCTGQSPKAPWLGWGPYLWADGLNPRSDGLIWQIDDFVTSDRTHPSTSGQKKVAEMLLKFLTTDLTSVNWFLKAGTKTGITEEIESKFCMMQNYPNPFNPSTVISYQLPEPSFVILKIFDSLGRIVETLVNSYQPAGKYLTNFNGTKFATGIYFYTLQTGNFTETKKMILIK